MGNNACTKTVLGFDPDNYVAAEPPQLTCGRIIENLITHAENCAGEGKEKLGQKSVDYCNDRPEQYRYSYKFDAARFFHEMSSKYAFNQWTEKLIFTDADLYMKFRKSKDEITDAKELTKLRVLHSLLRKICNKECSKKKKKECACAQPIFDKKNPKKFTTWLDDQYKRLPLENADGHRVWNTCFGYNKGELKKSDEKVMYEVMSASSFVQTDNYSLESASAVAANALPVRLDVTIGGVLLAFVMWFLFRSCSRRYSREDGLLSSKTSAPWGGQVQNSLNTEQ